MTILPIVSHVCMLEITIMVRLILASMHVIMARMVVLVAEAIADVEPAIDLQDSLNVSDRGLATEVFAINVMNLPLLDKLRRQNGVLEQHCLVLLV